MIGWRPWRRRHGDTRSGAGVPNPARGLTPLADGARRFVEELRISGEAVSSIDHRREELSMIERGHPTHLGNRGRRGAIDRDPGEFADLPTPDGLRSILRRARRSRAGNGSPLRGDLLSAPQVCGCHDLRVLRGVQLPDYEEAGHLLRVVLKTSDAGATSSLHCELRSVNEVLHCTARLETRARREATQTRRPISVKQFRQPDEARGLYEDALFHGPEFQVIHSIQKMDAQGATATLAGTSQMAWPSGPWQTEAAALNGVTGGKTLGPQKPWQPLAADASRPLHPSCAAS